MAKNTFIRGSKETSEAASKSDWDIYLRLVVHAESGLLGEVVTRLLVQTPIDRRTETEPEDKHEPHNSYHIVIPREQACVKHPREIVNGYRRQHEHAGNHARVVAGFEAHVEKNKVHE